uniref:Uncharacterized protein n=1 Tax=Avena sativa TaxID=4498 RepID=A0ACD5XYJ0_AVESA
MGGRAVVSDEEDDFIEADEQDPKLSLRGEDDMEDRDDEEEEEEEGDDVEDDDEDDEEEEGQNEYEKDGFIVDGDEDEEEEEPQESDDERRKKRKKKKRDSHEFRLDDDDLLLVAENTGTTPAPVNRLKRLKKAARESETEEASGFLDDDGSGNAYAEENVQDEIIDEEDQQADEDDDVDDFIVDDEIDEQGHVVKRSNAFKRPVQHAAGVSSAALQEAHDLFGDVDDLLARRTEDLERAAANSGESRGNRLEDEFDPIILSEKYMTPKDEQIRKKDIPERMQLSEELTGTGEKLSEAQREEESLWVHSQLTGDGFLSFVGNEQVNTEIDQKDILNVLTMLHVNKFEIPFIEMYRKESCPSLLKGYYATEQKNKEVEPKMRWYKLLWAVETLDRKWLLLQKRKIALKGYYQKRFDDEQRKIDDVTRHALRQQLHDTITEALKDANSDKEVDDVDAKFNLHFPPGEVEAVGQLKRPRRKSMYTICQKAGLRELANQFGRSAEQFGHHLTFTMIPEADDLESGKDSPEDVALNFTCAMFETPQDVLRGARHMAAVEIGCEPIVRKHIRSIFMDKAVVSTVPTPQGNLIIDPHHQLSRVKWLREKPLNKFVGAEWLLIQKGEDEKLLKVTVKLPEDAKKKLISEACENYLSDCVSKSAQIWDEQRKMILDDAFSSFLLPSMEKEARCLLTAKAKNWLRFEYGKQLWDKVSVSPWKKKDEGEKDDEEIDLDDESELRVMACCWGPGNPATTFVMLDSSGELVDVLYAGSISNKSRGGAEQERKNEDEQRAVKFMTDHQPHVLCVGASNMNSRQLKEAIFEVIFKIVEEHPRDMNEQIASLNSIYVDESFPRLYENSRISSDQLPGHSGIVKRAVALGRYLQNPLAMVATLCGPGKEILSWKLHTLQEFLTPEEKYEVVEQVMVDATNQIGFDVNLSASHEWYSSTLQFVAGLGPRKASALQKELVREGSTFSRKELVEPLGRKVFHNASGFLRVRRSGASAASSEIIDLLEDTRIHPESYALANKLAKDVYAEGAPRETDEMDEDEQEMAIERVRQRPDMLKRLNMDEYMKSIPEELCKRETLRDIKTELLCGFSDWRTPYAEPSSDEEFWMLSGETEDSLSDGRIVQVTVRHIQESRIVCTLDSGLKAIVLGDNYSDDGFDPESLRIREGDILTGKIKNVNKNRFQVYLTCKASDMRRPLSTRNHDPYYHEQAMDDERDKARKQKELAKKHFKPRMIVHPHFQNLTAEEANQFLSDKEVGEKVIRPSSRGPSFLTLTVKFSDGVYVHKEIDESGKDRKDITSLLRLGKTLTIDGETFEDLDEVVDRYVDPLVGHLKSMLSYRKFRKGLKGEVDAMLRADKAENPNRIVYSFGISHEHPGTFILTYIRGANPHHEYVGLYPKGFRFRKTDFNSIDRLVSYFQKHIDRPPPDAGMSMRNVAALVPMRDSAWGSGGSATGRAVSGAGHRSVLGNPGRSVPDGGSSGWGSWGGGGRGW